MKKYQAIRKRHPRFTYQSYSYYLAGQDLIIGFVFFMAPNIRFNPVVVIKNVSEKRLRSIPPEILENFIFHLGLAEIPSYWKCAVSPEIVIEAGYLSPVQIAWWKDLLEHGLAEFFYVNKIPFSKKFVRITSRQEKTRESKKKLRLRNRYLVPLGGGKDSFVTANILQQAKKEFRPLILGNVPAASEASRALTKTPSIEIKRKIDPKLISLNKKGYLNGHTPFSSYLAFLSALSAVVFDYRHIAISQERSSNEAQLANNKKGVNHQYSKSFIFEKKFRNYLARYLSKDVQYFSLLRPLYELQIAALFAKHPRYFKVFRSCNVNLKQNSWCGECPKCFTIYVILAPFLQEKELVKIFGKNLLEDSKLRHYLPEFLGQSKHRPFDCISTIKETETALSLITQKYKKENNPLPRLLARFKKELKPGKHGSSPLLHSWNSKNFVPRNLQKVIGHNISSFEL